MVKTPVSPAVEAA